MSRIDQLRARLAAAVEAGDGETADALRDAIDRIERGESKLTEQVPGRMGLGSSQERYVSEGGRATPPRKPDPLTRGHTKGGRRRP